MCSDPALAILMSVSPQMTGIGTHDCTHNNVTLSGTLDSHLRVGDEKGATALVLSAVFSASLRRLSMFKSESPDVFAQVLRRFPRIPSMLDRSVAIRVICGRSYPSHLFDVLCINSPSQGLPPCFAAGSGTS